MTQPSIIITGQPDWSHVVSDLVSQAFNVVHHTDSQGYMNALINKRAALLIVDGSDENWLQWVTPPKASPATRRIPIVVISDDLQIREQGLLSGADFVLACTDLREQLPQLVRDYARIPDEATLEQLDCECQAELPPLAQQGVAQFNDGEYYKQHDLFEAQWVKITGPVRDLYRAILQVGVAYYQIERGNYRGALKMLQRSVQWLLLLPDTCQGINVKKLREDSFRVRAELERLGEERFDEFDHDLIQGLEYRGVD